MGVSIRQWLDDMGLDWQAVVLLLASAILTIAACFALGSSITTLT